jgi:hypothetical protein
MQRIPCARIGEREDQRGISTGGEQFGGHGVAGASLVTLLGGG